MAVKINLETNNNFPISNYDHVSWLLAEQDAAKVNKLITYSYIVEADARIEAACVVAH